MTASPLLLARALGALDELGIPYAIGGSFASSLWGRPRQTMDLDINVFLDLEQAQGLAELLQGEFALSQGDMEDAIKGSAPFRSFQLLHIEEVFKIDAFVLDESPYTSELLRRRRFHEVAPGVGAAFLSPEDIVLTKLRWYVLGNRVSDRQLNDVVQVLEAQWSEFDFDYAKTWSGHFGIAEELETAMSLVAQP